MRLIDANLLKKTLCDQCADIAGLCQRGFCGSTKLIDSIPTVDAVTAAAYEQVAWERDLAIMQLKDIGKSLGEKMDDVAKVVRCKDCIHWDNEDGICWCRINSKMDLSGNWNMFAENDFCSYGERKADE